MSNKILAIIFSACLMMGVPAVANATNAIEIIDTETQNITLSVNETTLHIAGANGQEN